METKTIANVLKRSLLLGQLAVILTTDETAAILMSGNSSFSLSLSLFFSLSFSPSLSFSLSLPLPLSLLLSLSLTTSISHILYLQ